MKDEKELYKAYVRDIQRYPLLDACDEEKLSRRIEKGDKKALDSLVNFLRWI